MTDLERVELAARRIAAQWKDKSHTGYPVDTRSAFEAIGNAFWDFAEEIRKLEQSKRNG